MKDADIISLAREYQAEQREDEVLWFYRMAEKISPKVIVEIGIKEGGNLKVLSTLSDSTGITIGIDKRKDLPWKMDDAECEVHRIVGRSETKEVKEKLVSLLKGREIDLLFIDGDHSYEGMLQDFYSYGPLVRTGGIIAVHDIYYLEPVARAWKEIPGEDWYQSARNRSSIGIGFIIKEG
jgi:cephalosporin hydroxylase